MNRIERVHGNTGIDRNGPERTRMDSEMDGTDPNGQWNGSKRTRIDTGTYPNGHWNGPELTPERTRMYSEMDRNGPERTRMDSGMDRNGPE